MAQSREELHELLESLAPRAYFQPPQNHEMVYPCIRYELEYADTKFADNRPYARKKRYMVTVMDREPDSEIPDAVAWLPMCSFNRFYTVDDLNHWVFRLYF